MGHNNNNNNNNTGISTPTSSSSDNNNNNNTNTMEGAAAGAVTTVPPSPLEGKILLSATDFIATLEGEPPRVELQVRLPNDPAHQDWNFMGQTVTLSQIDVTVTVKEVKKILSQSHLNGMPATKIQLKRGGGGGGGVFLSNTATLAALNIGPTALLELKMKQRGGRKQKKKKKKKKGGGKKKKKKKKKKS